MLAARLLATRKRRLQYLRLYKRAEEAAILEAFYTRTFADIARDLVRVFLTLVGL